MPCVSDETLGKYPLSMFDRKKKIVTAEEKKGSEGFRAWFLNGDIPFVQT
jgi:hypothetical protein